MNRMCEKVLVLMCVIIMFITGCDTANNASSWGYDNKDNELIKTDRSENIVLVDYESCYVELYGLVTEEEYCIRFLMENRAPKELLLAITQVSIDGVMMDNEELYELQRGERYIAEYLPDPFGERKALFHSNPTEIEFVITAYDCEEALFEKRPFINKRVCLYPEGEGAVALYSPVISDSKQIIFSQDAVQMIVIECEYFDLPNDGKACELQFFVENNREEGILVQPTELLISNNNYLEDFESSPTYVPSGKRAFLCQGFEVDAGQLLCEVEIGFEVYSFQKDESQGIIEEVPDEALLLWSKTAVITPMLIKREPDEDVGVQIESIPFETVTIEENDECYACLYGVDPDWNEGYAIGIHMENNCNDAYMALDLAGAAINGFSVPSILLMSDIQPGQDLNGVIVIPESVIGLFEESAEFSAHILRKKYEVGQPPSVITEYDINTVLVGNGRKMGNTIQDAASLLAENDKAIITYLGTAQDRNYGETLLFLIDNGSDVNLSFYGFDAFMDGKKVDADYMPSTILAGGKGIGMISWDTSTLDAYSIKGLNRLEELRLTIGLETEDSGQILLEKEVDIPLKDRD